MNSARASKAQVISQFLDKSRPAILLTRDPDRSGTLSYRYTDTGEEILVPNVHYNRTRSVTTARYQALAVQEEKKALEVMAGHSPRLSNSARAQIAARYREKARKLRAKAENEGA